MNVITIAEPGKLKLKQTKMGAINIKSCQRCSIWLFRSSSSPAISLYVESRFLEPPKEKKIGSRNREVWRIGVKLQRSISKENENWFEKSGGLKNQGFEKSAFHVFRFILPTAIWLIPSFFQYFCMNIRNQK